MESPHVIIFFTFFVALEILKKLTGKHFKVLKAKFVIRNGKITIRKHHMRIVKSRSKRFSASKGFFSFKFHKKFYYMRFRSTGMKVFTMHKKKVITAYVRITKKRIIKTKKKGNGQYFSILYLS